MTLLPEVEVARKGLEKEAVGKRVKDVTVKTAAMVGRHRNRPEFAKALTEHKIEAVTRRGTWLLLELDGNAVLAWHLGPKGVIERHTANEDSAPATQAVITFTTGGALHYVDPARQGELFVAALDTEQGTESLRALTPPGIDPLADNTFTWPTFSERLRSRDAPLKTLLVDETVIVGLGDLYSDEILWAGGLAGGRHSATLSSQEVRRLYRAVLEILHEAVKQGGTSGVGGLAHHDLYGEPGGYGSHLAVFERAGKACHRCRQGIEHDEAMSIYFCRQCQT